MPEGTMCTRDWGNDRGWPVEEDKGCAPTGILAFCQLVCTCYTMAIINSMLICHFKHRPSSQS